MVKSILLEEADFLTPYDIYTTLEQCDICSKKFATVAHNEGEQYREHTQALVIGKYNKKELDYCKNHNDREIDYWIKVYKKENGLK